MREMIRFKDILPELLREASLDQLQDQFVETGKISQEIFDKIKEATSKGAYATWLVKHVVGEDIKEEDIYKYKKYFTVFHNHKRKYPSPDINKYGRNKKYSIQDFIKTSVEIADEIEVDPSKAKGVEKSEKYKNLEIGEVSGFTVYKLPKGSTHLHKASCDLGSGTEWCTAHSEAPDTFKDYIKQDDLYIFDNGKGEKYQFHYSTSQFVDKNDLSIINKTIKNNRLYSLFEFLEQKEGRRLPLELLLTRSPDSITPEDLNVKGELNFNNINIDKLPDNLKVGGSLNLSNTPISSLPDNLDVGGNLILYNTPISSLPNNLKVGVSLIAGNTKITSLPDNLEVKDNLALSNTKITSLPDNLEVGGSLFLMGTAITSLPDNLEVGGNLFLMNSTITSLPNNFKVKRDLRLSSTPIASLPDNLKVDGDLRLNNSSINSLPYNLEVGGYLDLRDTPLSNKYNINTIRKIIERKGGYVKGDITE